MARRNLLIIVALPALVWPGSVSAFRVCATDNSYAFSASTQYVVGELDFDGATGLASGSETTYNYSNREIDGFMECHVTYELSGIYEPSTETFLLEAQRTNYSPSCPGDLIDIEYPSDLLYGFQLTFDTQGSSQVRLAASGELLANGEWEPGKLAYTTDEVCTIF